MTVLLADAVDTNGEPIAGHLLPDGRIVFISRGVPVIEEVAVVRSERPGDPRHTRAAIALWLADQKHWDSGADDAFECWSWLESLELLTSGGPVLTRRADKNAPRIEERVRPNVSALVD